MSITNVSNVSQAMASYAAQLQTVRSRESFPETEPGQRDPAQEAPAVDLVTLNSLHPRSEADLLTDSNKPGIPRIESAAPQAAAPVAEPDPAMTSKSITRALEAYIQTSMV